jgi:serine/threonine-protein kinase
VAIKVLPPHLAQDAESLARFEREARAVAALAHPNVVVLYDCGTERGVSYVVMELLEGESLRTRLGRGPLPWPQALQLGFELADGLYAAHSKGIIHRDLKPENIFLTPDGRAKILDFGLARLDGSSAPPRPALSSSTASLPPDTRNDHASTASATVDWSAYAETLVPRGQVRSTLMGTVGYMSPEHLRGQNVDARTDLFALGCVLYEMLTGCRAFSRATQADTITAVLAEEPPEIAALVNGAPAGIEHVIRKCLAKNREERYASAREVRTELQRILTEVTAPGMGLLQRFGVWLAAALLTLGLVLGFIALRRDPVPRDVDSIAVLPFTAPAGDERATYAGEGIADRLVDSLSQIQGLRVMSRTSVNRMRKDIADPRELGQWLGVRVVLTGRVWLSDERLAIDLELIDTSDGRRLWGQKYERSAADLQAVQAELVVDIAEKLHVRLTREQRAQIAQQPTQDATAYEQYVKGRYFWNKRTHDGMRRAIDSFNAAATQDPAFALAHAGLADSYNLLGSYGYVAPKEAFPKAKAAALAALERDAALAEAHAALAQIYELWERNWSAAEQSYQRALRLNPKYATAHHWYAFFLAETGRFNEAKDAILQAKKLEPLSLGINTAHGWILYLAREYNGAAEQLRQTLVMEPQFALAHASLGLVLAQQGKYEQAIASIQKAQALAPDDAEFLAQLGYVYGRAGQPEEARHVLERLQNLTRAKYVSPYYLAYVHAGLGEKDEALAWLDRAFEENACALVSLNIDPLLDSLREDSRFQKLLQRVRLPE